MAAVDLLDRIAIEDDDEYTLQPGLRYKNSNDEKGQIPFKPNKKKSKRFNGYETVNMDAGDATEHNSRNPFDEVNDNFKQEDDPETYVAVYNHIKLNIKSIQTNINSVSKLRDNFNLSDSQKQYQCIMNELDEIMMENSKLTRKIKNLLQEEKTKNDKLGLLKDHKSSSLLQWRVNKLNSSVREFKLLSIEFERELNATQNALKQKEKRKLIEFDEENELNEEKIDYMVDHPNELECFLQKKFEGMAASDALLERVHELEDRHQGMLKIEKSIKELHQLWMELNVMVTEQQENLDRIQDNVEQTKDYMERATKNIVSAEKKQKMSRKMACCVVCLLLIIIILVIVFVGGFIKFN